MFGSRSTEERLIEDVSSTSSDKTRRYDACILKNVLDRNPDYEEDSELMQVFEELAFVGRIDDLIILSAEDLRNLHAHLDKNANAILPMSNITGIKHLQCLLKYLQ